MAAKRAIRHAAYRFTSTADNVGAVYTEGCGRVHKSFRLNAAQVTCVLCKHIDVCNARFNSIQPKDKRSSKIHSDQ